MGRIATGLDRDLLALRDLIRHRYPAETVEQQREIDGAIAMYQLTSPDAATWDQRRWNNWLTGLGQVPSATEASPRYDETLRYWSPVEHPPNEFSDDGTSGRPPYGPVWKSGVLPNIRTDRSTGYWPSDWGFDDVVEHERYQQYMQSFDSYRPTTVAQLVKESPFYDEFFPF